MYITTDGSAAVRTDVITLTVGVSAAAAAAEAAATGATNVSPPPYVIRYTATDAAGNAASVSRTVSVYDPCTPAERWCPDAGLCSVSGICLSFNPCLSNTHRALFPALCHSSPTEDGTEFAIVADTIPPRITVGGPGPLAAVGPEAYVRYTYISAAPTAAWVDPGVRGEDNVDGDISGSVAVFGLKALQTEWVTTLGAPGVLTYMLRDAAGNEAVPQQRWVFVACTPGERECAHGSGRTFCSTSGVCVEPELPVRDTPPVVTLLVCSHAFRRLSLALRVVGRCFTVHSLGTARVCAFGGSVPSSTAQPRLLAQQVPHMHTALPMHSHRCASDVPPSPDVSSVAPDVPKTRRAGATGRANRAGSDVLHLPAAAAAGRRLRPRRSGA